MIPTTTYEADLSRRCQSGELCARVLDHGDFCGREIDKAHGLELCTWHSEEFKGLPHRDDDLEPPTEKNVCSRCRKRPVAYRVSRLCGNCHKVMHRQNVVESGKRSKRL